MNDFTQSVLNNITGGNEGVPTSISRPNYQREKAKSRLVAFDFNPPKTNNKAQVDSISTIQSDNSPKLTIKMMDKTEPVCTPSIQPREKSTQYSQKHCNGNSSLKVVKIDKPDKRVCSVLKFGYQDSNSILTAYSDKCLLSYLFALSDIFSKASFNDYDYKWNQDTGFKLKLSGSEENISVAEKILSEECQDNVKICFIENPDNIIYRNLSVSSKFACGISNVHEYQYIGLLDKYFKNNKDSMLEFSDAGNNLIVSGEKGECLKALEYIFNNMDRGELNE